MAVGDAVSYVYNGNGVRVSKTVGGVQYLLDGSTIIGEKTGRAYTWYYCDNEAGFYALQSRYYDPEIGRFVNADSIDNTMENSDDLLSADCCSS